MAINTGGYATGISTQPIDVSKSVQNYMQSAVEQKLAEIERGRAEVDENSKRVLKALSVSVLPELSGALRDNYQKELDSFRSEMVNRMKRSEGKLTLDDQKFIEQKSVDLSNRMNMSKNQLAKMAEVQKMLADPKAHTFVNVPKAALELRNFQEDFQAGKPVDDPATIIMRNYKMPTTVEYVSANYKNILDRIDTGEDITVDGVTWKKETFDDPKEIRKFVDFLSERDATFTQLLHKYEDGQFTFDPEKAEQEKQTLVELLQRKKTETGVSSALKPPTPRSGGSSASKRINFTPQQVQVGDRTLNIVGTPSTIPQVDREISIDTAYNTDTKKEERIDGKVEIVGVDVDNDVILLRGMGGLLKKGDESALSTKQKGIGAGASNAASKNDALNSAATPSQIRSKSNDILKQNFKDQYPDIAKDYKDDQLTIINPELKETENGYVLTGQVSAKKKRGIVGRVFGADEKEETFDIEVSYEFIRDPQADVRYTIPLYENKDKVANWFGKVDINNVQFEEYFRRYEQGRQTSQPSTSTKASESVNVFQDLVK